ncbi:MAG TPA: ATP synthase F1 subunit delta [Bryobacteraceae bacterium]|jgi:F-type H+-transporting ATPase subunit delta|nr:ATP synthase F1 subunit delta [Bryobacteraceae bacterium]
MTLTAVISRYVEALADVVTGSGSTVRPQEALEQLRAFDAVWGSSTPLRNALVSPSVPAARKRAVVNRIADQLGLSRIIRNFLFVLIDHRRIAEVPQILPAFELVLDQRLGFARAEVASARELSEADRTILNGKLERLTGKRIRMHFSVDESLIGGVVARLGSTVYDGSLRSRLHGLERRLAAEE